jgi:hypothetical protein
VSIRLFLRVLLAAHARLTIEQKKDRRFMTWLSRSCVREDSWSERVTETL